MDNELRRKARLTVSSGHMTEVANRALDAHSIDPNYLCGYQDVYRTR